MKKQRLLLGLLVGLLAVTSAFAQFTPRKDYAWARDVSVAANPTITLDGVLNEPMWAKAESVMVVYGVIDGNPGSGYKITQGTGPTTDSTRAVIKFLSNKTTNTLYIAVHAPDSSVGGDGWENSDGILGGIYNRLQHATNLITLQQDMFISWVDSSGLATLPNLKGGALPTNGTITAAAAVQGVSNQDTNSSGQKVADQGWTIEMAVNLDSLGYNANSAETDEVQMSMSIWDVDWPKLPDHIATKSWWGNEWGNNGGSLAGRVLLRNDVDVNTAVVPTYPPDLIVPNGQNYANVVVDGNLTDSIWSHVPSFDIQFGNSVLRASYPTIGKDRSGQWVTEGTDPFNAGVARVKMFFKADTLYVGADISDRSLNHYVGDDFFDGLQISMNVPIDTLYDKNVHVMAAKRFGVAIDSVAKGGSSLLWDAKDWAAPLGALWYGLQLKPGSTIDNNTDVDAGYTFEMAFDLTKLGYSAGQMDKILAIGADYHDYDLTATDTSAYRVWWFREWPWASSPAFVQLSNTSLVTGIAESGNPQVVQEFRLYGNYPNPFNPTTKIQFSVPGAGVARLMVFDILGRQVNETAISVPSGGVQERTFDASRLASGVYFYRVEFTSATGGRRMSETKSMMLVK